MLFPQDDSVSPGDKKNWNRNDSQKSSLNGCESPKFGRKPMSATSTEDLIASKSFGDSCISNISLELETIKQEIVREMRKEINRMKLDIIESMYYSFIINNLSVQLKTINVCVIAVLILAYTYYIDFFAVKFALGFDNILFFFQA